MSVSRIVNRIEKLVLQDPLRVKIFRKVLDQNSGKPLFKLAKIKITRVTDHTYITDKGKVYRKNHISLRHNFNLPKISATPGTVGDSLSEDSLITGPQLELVEAPVSTPQGLAPVIATSTTPIVDPSTHPDLTSTSGAVTPPQDLPQTSDKVPQTATEDSANTGNMEVDNPTSQSSSEFRSSNRSKKPTRFYGDPLRHSVKSVTESDPAEPSTQR